MGKRAYALLIILGLIVVFFSTVRHVQATLGEPYVSVETDRKALSAMRRPAREGDGYAVHEISSDSTTVREYVSPSGIVFGIAWNGLLHPDLTTLLGSYAEEYHKVLRRTPRSYGHRRRQVRANGVVVEKWGHMRDLRGRAYVPALVPPGVSINEIK